MAPGPTLDGHCILAVEYPDSSSDRDGLSSIPFDRMIESYAIAVIMSPPPELISKLKPGMFITARREDPRRTVVALVRGLRGRGKVATVTEDGCFVGGERTQAGVGIKSVNAGAIKTDGDWRGMWYRLTKASFMVEWMSALRFTQQTTVMALAAALRVTSAYTSSAGSVRGQFDMSISSCELWASGLGPAPALNMSTDRPEILFRLESAARDTRNKFRSSWHCAIDLDNMSDASERTAVAEAIRSVVTFPQLAISGMGYPQ